MTAFRFSGFPCLLFALAAALPAARAQSEIDPLTAAKALYHAGESEKAQAAFDALAKAEPQNAEVQFSGRNRNSTAVAPLSRNA